MNIKVIRTSSFPVILATALMLVVSPSSGLAQGIDWRFGFGAEFDNNMFLLGKSASSALSNGTTFGGRFDGMSAPGDIVGSAFAEADFKITGLGGKRLRLVPAVRVDRPTQNSARRALQFGFNVEQNLPKDGRFRLKARVTPQYFSKNYLVGAADSNGDGVIQSSERSYSRGEVGENAFGADVRLRLAKSKRSSPFGAFVTFGGGFAQRTYAAPFAERNRSGATGELALDLEWRSGMQLDFDYQFEAHNSSPWQQVMVIDEPKLGQDLNGDGDTQDLDIRHMAQVDRSRNVHVLGFGIERRASERASWRIEVDGRRRIYTTTDAGDFGHNGRKDTRIRAEGTLTIRTGGPVRFNLNAGWVKQTNNKPLELGSVGESNDYRKLFAGIGMEIRL